MKKIVLIEKDAAAAHIILLLLADEGFEIEVFGPLSAIDVIQGAKPALILLHNGLNNYGISLCQEIKSDTVLNTTPVIVMSLEIAAKSPALEAGANCFLQKPFDINELSAEVNRLIWQI